MACRVTTTFFVTAAALLLSSANGFGTTSSQALKTRRSRSAFHLCPDQGTQLIAASCSAYEVVGDIDSASSQAADTKNDSKQNHKNNKAFLTKMMSISPVLLPHMPWEKDHEHAHEDGYITPIVGFQWVDVEDDEGNEMVVIPSCSLGTQCRLPDRGQEVVGWFNEVCMVDL